MRYKKKASFHLRMDVGLFKELNRQRVSLEHEREASISMNEFLNIVLRKYATGRIGLRETLPPVLSFTRKG
jgi:hypothetical protein